MANGPTGCSEKVSIWRVGVGAKTGDYHCADPVAISGGI